MELTQYGGWFAIGYLIIKDAIIPIIRKSIPAKVKSDIKTEQEQQRHQFMMEQKRLDAEIEYKKNLAESIAKLSETSAAQVEISRLQGEQIRVIADDTKAIKERLDRTRKATK